MEKTIEQVKEVSAAGFGALFPIFKLLGVLSQDKRFSYELDFHYRKNEYVCEIDLHFEEYNLELKDVAIIWFNDSDDNIADAGHFEEVCGNIRDFIGKINALTSSKISETLLNPLPTSST